MIKNVKDKAYHEDRNQEDDDEEEEEDNYVGNTNDDVDDDDGLELHEFCQLRWMLYKGNGSLGAPQSEDTQFDVNLSSTDLLKVSKYIQVLGII